MTALHLTAALPAPVSRPDGPPTPRRYLVTWVGALLGILVIGGLGVAVGLGLMALYHDPDAGLANLALLLFPLVLGGVGTLAGMFVGTRAALRRRGDALATQTAGVAAGLAALGLVLAVATHGIGGLLLLAVPVVARWLLLQDHPAE